MCKVRGFELSKRAMFNEQRIISIAKEKTSGRNRKAKAIEIIRLNIGRGDRSRRYGNNIGHLARKSKGSRSKDIGIFKIKKLKYLKKCAVSPSPNRAAFSEHRI